MKERAALSDRLRSFGPVMSREAVAKCLSDGRVLVARERGLKIQQVSGEGAMLPWRSVGGVD